MHTNRIHILLALSFTWFINICSYAQEIPKSNRAISAEPKTEIETVNLDSLKNITPVLKEQDSTLNDSIKPKKELLASSVKYTAKDYTSLNRKEQKLYLYNEAEVYYDNMQIKSGIIVIDFNKNEVYAGRLKDSTGAYTQRPYFKQGENIVEPDSIRFNINTKKALIWNSVTEQQGMNIKAELTKRVNDSVYYMSDAKLTTSENLDDPEYYFKIRKESLYKAKK